MSAVLRPNTTYYIRAYAQNQEEIGYSSVVSFTTLDGLTGFDPFYKDQWYLENTGQYGGKVGIDVNVKGVWQQGYLGTGISIGILDGIVDYTHTDLKDNLTSDRVVDFNKYLVVVMALMWQVLLQPVTIALVCRALPRGLNFFPMVSLQLLVSLASVF